ncbi:MAG: nucleoside phosphorylase [Chitinophagales bacterium]|nr:nucleoside phosphorylase [Chitinophagales bacterium]
MSETVIPESEFIVHPDGSIYHLHLKPEQVADTVITVGDPRRVREISRHFDVLQHEVEYREFVTHTGFLNNKQLTVLSTGIGTENIDIVLNELDALVNIDFATRTVRKDLRQLDIIRLGTSGSVCEDITNDEIIVSEAAIGLDGLLNFYEHENSIQETVYREAFFNHIKPYFTQIEPYIASADESLLQKFEPHFKKGTTLTSCGFYAPQGRMLRAKKTFPDFIGVIKSFRHKHFRITNLEMETAAIYGLGRLLGHRCLSVNAILANRIHHTFSNNPAKTVERMIEQSLEIITR